MKQTLVAPSLLSADPMKFGEELRSVEDAGADLHHVDVMDGHFVPNLTYGLPFLTALKKVTRIPLDVHIMISNPEIMALEYVKAGADRLCFHVEVVHHHHRLIEAIKEQGCKAGVAINPLTSLCLLEPLLPYIDQINVMGVNPGFSGQKFIPGTIERLKLINDMVKKAGRLGQMDLEVDGGVNADNAHILKAAGATLFVAGNFVYTAKNRADAIRALKKDAVMLLPDYQEYPFPEDVYGTLVEFLAEPEE